MIPKCHKEAEGETVDIEETPLENPDEDTVVTVKEEPSDPKKEKMESEECTKAPPPFSDLNDDKNTTTET